MAATVLVLMNLHFGGRLRGDVKKKKMDFLECCRWKGAGPPDGVVAECR